MAAVANARQNEEDTQFLSMLLPEMIRKQLDKHKNTIQTTLLFATVLILQLLFINLVFQCPCDHDNAFYYAWCFLLVPTALLFLVGVFFIPLTCRMCQGYAKRNDITSPPKINYVTIFLQALIMPFAWIFIALMEGNLFACAYTMDVCRKVTSEEFKMNVVFSQEIGWVLLAVVVATGSFILCCARCCSKHTYVEKQYIEIYREIEARTLEGAMQNRARKQIERNVSVLQKRLTKEAWDAIGSNPPEDFYSALESFAAEELESEPSTSNA